MVNLSNSYPGAIFPAPPSSSIVPPPHSPPIALTTPNGPPCLTKLSPFQFYSLVSMPTSIRVLSSKSFILSWSTFQIVLWQKEYSCSSGKLHFQPYCFFLVHRPARQGPLNQCLLIELPGCCPNEWFTRSNSTFLFLRAARWLACLKCSSFQKQLLLLLPFFAIMTSKTYGLTTK